jgi:hypothetical protein
MARLTHSECFDLHTRNAFARGWLDEESAASLLRHVADCPACARSVGQLVEEVEQSRAAAARAHGEAWRREESMAAVVAALAGAAGALRLALERWAMLGAQSVRGKVRTVGRGAEDFFRWEVEGFEGMELASRGAARRGLDDTSGVVRTRGGLSRSRPGEAIEIPLGDGRTARCTVEKRQELVVRFPVPLPGGPPVVLVVPDSGGAPFGMLATEYDGESYIARAEAPDGDFSVIPGPVGS